MSQKTILITGASSGIGKATAIKFQAEGWNVIATMRKPEAGSELAQLDNVLVTCLDVTDSEAIATAVTEGIDRFGKIDALLNNAGYGAYGPLEAFSMEKIRRQFDTNVIGLLETTKAILPHFRQQKSGIILNVSSIGGKVTYPLGSLYHGTKFAVEGISEALQYELAPIGIKVKLIEPGAIKTDFGGRSFDFTNDETITEYQGTVQALMKALQSVESIAPPSPPEEVASAIWDCVNDGTDKLRYPAAGGSDEILANRAALDDEAFFQGMKQQFGL
ncbi:MAG: SDR family oxidoreductase [Cyanobacteria bacterium P01_E01_bin.42]